MKNFSIEIKWALIFTVVSLAWMYAEKAAGLHDIYIAQHAKYTMLFMVPAILIYALAIIDKKQNNYFGSMTWKQGFVSGIVVASIIALLCPAAQYITHVFISPDYFVNAIDYAVEKNVMTQAHAETYFNLKSYIIQSVFGSLSMGVLTAAIVSFFVRTKNLPK